MKKQNRFYWNIVVGIFITVFIASLVISNRTLEMNNLIAPAGVIIYPLVYFLSTVYLKKFGKKEAYELILSAIVSIIFFGFLLIVANAVTVSDYNDGLEPLFNVDFRVIVSSVAAFYVGLNLNLSIYSTLKRVRKTNFLISSIISFSVDSLIFSILSFAGRIPLKDLINLASGHFITGLLLVTIFGILFANIVPDSFEEVIKVEF